MTRRESFQRLALLFGGAVIAPEALAHALAGALPTTSTIPVGRLALLDEMAETILPETDTPGAKAAKVGEFILQAVEYSLPPAKQQQFWTALETAENDCQQQLGQSFVQCTPQQREQFFTKLQAEQKAKGNAGGYDFFTQLKTYVLHGYFTSEIGATQALAYDPVPGAWIPDMIINPETTKAWTPLF